MTVMRVPGFRRGVMVDLLPFTELMQRVRAGDAPADQRSSQTGDDAGKRPGPAYSLRRARTGLSTSRPPLPSSSSQASSALSNPSRLDRDQSNP